MERDYGRCPGDRGWYFYALRRDRIVAHPNITNNVYYCRCNISTRGYLCINKTPKRTGGCWSHFFDVLHADYRRASPLVNSRCEKGIWMNQCI